jgi:hypothetical protein
MPGSHAILSPSAASRWMVCTPSARLEQQFPDSEGDAAREGTLAHAIGELMIRRLLWEFGETMLEEKIDAAVKELDPEDKFYSPAMLEYCTDYAQFVIDKIEAARKINKDAHFHLETVIDLTAHIPEGFGTVDARIICDGTMDIIDLKFGKGVHVSAVENKQMMVYALGALEECDMLFDINTVRMTIYQPRISNYSEWEISVADLRAWGETELKEKARLAFAGEGEFVAGTHCRFCRAAALCRANAEYNLELAKMDFRDPNLLDDYEVSDVLSRIDALTNWAKKVADHALFQAVNHDKHWPDYKLVEGRANRKYSDQAAVAKALLGAGFAEDLIYKPKELQGLTELSKRLKKKAFDAHVGPLLIKPPGKPALVLESDKRPAISSTEAAAADFAEAYEETEA